MSSAIKSYQDAAIILAWPDTTARGDHTWCNVLKRIGILKNQNFKVGHAAIMLVEGTSGNVHYFDFGRYLTPRGYGRARSVDTDPCLEIKTKAQLDPTNNQSPILNLDAVLSELESIKQYSHGNGPLYASVCLDFDFQKGFACAMDFVHRGSMIYSAFMPGNSNCSRFVESVLISGLNPQSKHRKSLIVHETLVSSPISNVVNGSCNGHIYIVDDGILQSKPMSRADSRSFFISQTIANFKSDAAAELPTDSNPGHTHEPERPTSLPPEAQWLGGIGEGAWFQIQLESDIIKVVKYDLHGNAEFERSVESTEVNWEQSFKVVYDTHASKLTILQHNRRISMPLHPLKTPISNNVSTPNLLKTEKKHELQYS
jgi:hypothetical protein